MFIAFMLAYAGTALPAPPVVVSFGSRGVVRVPLPPPQGSFEARPEPTLFSPRGDAAAVRACWDIPKYATCQVILARPGQVPLTLNNSAVLRLLWTPDGQYLIGAGKNTVRVWNLVGGVRVQRPPPPHAPPAQEYQVQEITSLKLVDNGLCVALLSDLFPSAGGNAIAQTTSAVLYALPSLRVLGTTCE